MTAPDARTDSDRLTDATVWLLSQRHVEPGEIATVIKAMATTPFLQTPLVQALLMDDRITQVRRLLLRLGRKKFGPPSPDQEAAGNEIADLTRLEHLLERLLEANSWQELLAQ